ncbi:hypothetical protein COP1_047082 [Malus domestica]
MAHLSPRFPHRGVRVQLQQQPHQGLVYPQLLALACPDGINSFLPLDQALELVGLGVDGCDCFEVGADEVGPVGRLNFDGCGGLR